MSKLPYLFILMGSRHLLYIEWLKLQLKCAVVDLQWQKNPSNVHHLQNQTHFLVLYQLSLQQNVNTKYKSYNS